MLGGTVSGMDVTRSSHIIPNKWHTFQFMSSEIDRLDLLMHTHTHAAAVRTLQYSN